MTAGDDPRSSVDHQNADVDAAARRAVDLSDERGQFHA